MALSYRAKAGETPRKIAGGAGQAGEVGEKEFSRLVAANPLGRLFLQ